MAILLIAFAPTLVWLVREWTVRPEYSHGFLMPLIAGWVVWTRRDELRALPRRDSAAGWALVLIGFVLLLLGEMKLSESLMPIGLCVSLAGLATAFRGWRGLRGVAPALIALFLMCPIPVRFEQSLTVPLKNFAALVATGLFNLTGVDATLEGNTIHILGIDSLWVAEACSGIRSLISLCSVALLAAVFWKRPWWQRASLVLAAVPIAVAVNAARIWVTGMISIHGSPELAQGVLHQLEGFLLFGISSLVLFGFAWTLEWLRGGEAA